MMKLSNWMMMEFLPRDKAADKYIVGQNLTTEQAREIIHIIARSVEFYLDFPWARRDLHVVGSPFRDFTVSMVLLILAGATNEKWFSMLWNAMDDGLHDACNDVMYAMMGYPDGFCRSIGAKK